MFLYVCYENEAVKQGGQLVIRTDQGLLPLGTVQRISAFWMLGVRCQQLKAAGLRAEKGAWAIGCQGLFYLTVEIVTFDYPGLDSETHTDTA